MVKLSICIGSYCFLKGSRQVAARLQELIERDKLEESVDLQGSFCMGICSDDVSVTVDGETFSVSPETVDSFYAEHVLAKVSA